MNQDMSLCFVVELMITNDTGGYYLQVAWNLWISTVEKCRCVRHHVFVIKMR